MLLSTYAFELSAQEQSAPEDQEQTPVGEQQSEVQSEDGEASVPSQPTVAPAPPLPSALELFQTDIKHQLFADQYHIVDNQGDELALLIYESEIAISKGLVFLIGDAHQSSKVDSSLQSLAQILPQWGWTTIMIPAPNLLELEDDGTSDEQDILPKSRVKGDSNAMFERYQEDLLATVSASKASLEDVNGHRVIFAKGISAAAITTIINDKKLDAIDALIINSPYFPDRLINKALAAQIAELEVPVLDLTSRADNMWSQQTQRSREVQARVKLKEIYRQRYVHGHADNLAQTSVFSKDFYGFTTFLGW